MKNLLTVFFLLLTVQTIAQKVENIIVITTDGLRWQEVFGGMDTAIAHDRKFNQNDSAWLYGRYWSKDVEKRRELLMPNLWKLAGKQGQLYGNRWVGNKVNNANPYWFSYPGYSEIFTGFPDTAINSNDYPPNPHVTVLEYLHRMPEYKGRVAAFGAWEAFDRILNEQRAGFQVVSAFDTTLGKLSEGQKLVNSMLKNSHRPFHDNECLDVFTHYAAFEFLKQHKPRILYISYGETDEWAHHAQYRFYLDAARQVDSWIGELWEYVQSAPEYRNKTALLITTDHGRGNKVKAQWTSHGQSIEDASEIWFAVLSPLIRATGEVKGEMQIYQKQFAATIAALLGKNYAPEHPVAAPVPLIK